MRDKWFVGLLAVTLSIGIASTACAEWKFGLGTGPQRLSISGDAGFGTFLGPVDLDVDISASDIGDMTDNALGLGGYATNGDWMFQAFAGKLQLEGGASGLGPTATLSAKLDFDVTGAELTGGYYFYKTPAFRLMGYTGLRYLRHEMDLLITGTGFLGVNRNKSIDESWTDVLFGLSADVPFAEKWNWNIKTDAGFGGSEGTYLASTGVTWNFYGGWSTNLYGKYVAVEYENGNRGETNWYLYDIDESTLGLNLLYGW